jgi:GWxTD domain-containing protein
MYFENRTSVLISLLMALVGSTFADADVPELGSRFDEAADRASAVLIARVAGEDSSAAYASLSRSEKAVFLDAFWKSHNPLVHKYYYGLHLGRRRFNISDYFFERMPAVPELFKRHIDRPDPKAVDHAENLVHLLNEQLLKDSFALCALGYILLEGGRFEEADRVLLDALKIDRKFVEARSGRGLAQLALGKRAARALEEFRNTSVLDSEYAAPKYNLAMAHLVIRSREIGRWFEQVIDKFPDHPDAHFKLGAFHETGLVLEKDPDLPRAAEAYNRQVSVNPDHAKAWFQLGSVLLQSGHPQEAIDMWERLMKERPRFRERYLTLLLEAYQKAGHPKLAEETAEEYIAGLDEETQDLFKDITIITTPAEKAEYEALDRWDRLAFVRRFWQKRDPSPATIENERRVEHYRRVIYAMRNFSEARKPWDRRGEVYVRYGEPAHKSRWDNIRFEFTLDVVTVKERLLSQLPGPARREIISRSRVIRQSVRDRDPEAGEFNDFVGVEFELNTNRRDHTPKKDGSQNSNKPWEGATYGVNSFTSLERMIGTESIRGLPLFPVEPDKPWEYWIYPYVGDGVEIVFVSLTYAEDFYYPRALSGRAKSIRNATTWTHRLPEEVVARTIKRQGDRYEQPTPVIDYTAASADFQGDGKKTRVELYYGIPLDGLSTTVPDTGKLAAGLAVFDTAWNPLYRTADTIRYLATANTGKIATGEMALSLPPGEYLIGTQFQDLGGARLAAATNGLRSSGMCRGRSRSATSNWRARFSRTMPRR